MRLAEDQEKEFITNKRLQELTFDNMVKHLRATIVTFPDRRTGQNTQYSLEDVALGAFSVFFTQVPLFCHFKDPWKKRKVKAMPKLYSQ